MCFVYIVRMSIKFIVLLTTNTSTLENMRKVYICVAYRPFFFFEILTNRDSYF
jgi:hypothetical protein